MPGLRTGREFLGESWGKGCSGQRPNLADVDVNERLNLNLAEISARTVSTWDKSVLAWAGCNSSSTEPGSAQRPALENAIHILEILGGPQVRLGARRPVIMFSLAARRPM